MSILPGAIVLDVGANIGVFTLFAAKQGAQVYAYEQVPPTFEVLLHNIHLHQLEALPTRGTSEYRIGWKKN